MKRAKVSSEDAAIQKQLTDAQKEAQNAMGERGWMIPYDEKVWLEEVERVRRFARRQRRNANLFTGQVVEKNCFPVELPHESILDKNRGNTFGDYTASDGPKLARR